MFKTFLLSVIGFLSLLSLCPTLARAAEIETNDVEMPQGNLLSLETDSGDMTIPIAGEVLEPDAIPIAGSTDFGRGEAKDETVTNDTAQGGEGGQQNLPPEQEQASYENNGTYYDDETYYDDSYYVEGEQYYASAEEPAVDTGTYEEPVAEDVAPLAEVKPSTQKLELEDVTFQCDDSNNVPATIAKIKDKDEVLVVLWASDFFDAAGYNAQTRCNQVSARFEAYKEDELLTYITTGKLNGQPVICLTSKEDGDCGEGISFNDGLLFTLKSTTDSEAVLEDLATVLQSGGTSGQQPLEQ